MLGIYKFDYDTYRSGSLSGIFLATREQIELLLSRKIYLGEVLGKHSEVYFDINELKPYIKLVTEDEDAIRIFSNFNLYSGTDLTEYLEDDDDE